MRASLTNLAAVASALLCLALVAGWAVVVAMGWPMFALRLREVPSQADGVWVDRWSVGLFDVRWPDIDRWDAADALAFTRLRPIDRRALGFRYDHDHRGIIVTVAAPGVHLGPAGGMEWSDQRVVGVPLLPIMAVLAACPTVVWRRAARVRRRRRLGLCQSCGYDLRQTAERCAECGAPTIM